MESETRSQIVEIVEQAERDFLILSIVCMVTEARSHILRLTKVISEKATTDRISVSSLPEWTQLGELAKEMFALEGLLDFALVYAKGELLITPQKLSLLLTYVDRLRYISKNLNKKDLAKSIDGMMDDYQDSISYHLSKGGVLPTLATRQDLERYLEEIYQQDIYLERVFGTEVGLPWREFVDIMKHLISMCLVGPRFITLARALKISSDAPNEGVMEDSLQKFTYTRRTAEISLDEPMWKRELPEGRMLLWRPVVAVGDNIVFSTQLLLDSLERYRYHYRKKVGAFVKNKGHVFEKEITDVLKKHGMDIVACNLVIDEEIVAGESRAEFDIIAGKAPVLLVIECKAYQPDIGFRMSTISQRRQMATNFSKKLFVKCQFLANNPERFFSSTIYDLVVPLLVSTYPLAREAEHCGVNAVTVSELSNLLAGDLQIGEIRKMRILYGKNKKR